MRARLFMLLLVLPLAHLSFALLQRTNRRSTLIVVGHACVIIVAHRIWFVYLGRRTHDDSRRAENARGGEGVQGRKSENNCGLRAAARSDLR